MGDRRVEAVMDRVKGCNSISSLNVYMQYCINPENKEQLFMEFDEYSNINGDVKGSRNVADYHIMNAVLERLKDNHNENFIHTNRFGAVETETFLNEKKFHFLEVCPLEYISHPNCSKETLDEMALGKYKNIEVKSIEFNENVNGNINNYKNDSIYKNFNEKEGPIIARILSNMHGMPGATGVDKSKISHIFFKGLLLENALRNGQQVVSETMFNSAKENHAIGEFISDKTIYKNDDYKTLKFISDNFKELTKRLTSMFILNNKKSQIREDLLFVQKRIDEVLKEKEKDMSKFSEKTELTNIISEKSRPGSRESFETAMMADLFNVPEYDIDDYYKEDRVPKTDKDSKTQDLEEEEHDF